MPYLSDIDIGIPAEVAQDLAERRRLYRRFKFSYPEGEAKGFPYTLETEPAGREGIYSWLTEAYFIMRRIQASQKPLIVKSKGNYPSNSSFWIYSLLAQDILRHIERCSNPSIIGTRRQLAKISPLVRVFYSLFVRGICPSLFMGKNHNQFVELFLGAIDQCKARISGEKFKRRKDLFERSTRLNETSLRKYKSHLESRYDNLSCARLERVMNLIAPAVDSADGQTQAVPDGRDG